jgi:hypothetical protein
MKGEVVHLHFGTSTPVGYAMLRYVTFPSYYMYGHGDGAHVS